MGTTGTIMGCSTYFKQQNPDIQIIGLQPVEGSSIPGIRRWPEAYLPAIYEAPRVDRVLDISQRESEQTMRRLAGRGGDLLRCVIFGRRHRRGAAHLQRRSRMR